MEIIYDIHKINTITKDTYIAIGTFDGVHLGHKKIINNAITKAKEKNGKSLIFTFANHPLEIIKKDFIPNYLTTIDEKSAIFEQMGIDYLVLQQFDQSFANTDPHDFVKLLKNNLKVKEIFVGFNFTFGKNGSGDTKLLKKIAKDLDIKINELAPVTLDNTVISSTLIRDLIIKGKIKEANKYLGYPFFIKEKVIPGEQIARRLGFPTANLDIRNKIIPKFGVYGGNTTIDDDKLKRSSIINVGNNPTLKEGINTFEVHIFDYKGDLYNKTIKVELLEYIREEKKFSTIEALKKTINDNINYWRASNK